MGEAFAFWERPWRMVQPNLRLIDGYGLDAKGLVDQVVEYGGNVLLVNAGGIVAWYPTRLPYQPVNEFLSGDFLGAVVRQAHQQGLHVLARLDLSKNHPELYAEHPDWFQVTPEGEVRRDQTSSDSPHSHRESELAWRTMLLTCFHGPYWQEHAFRLVAEIMSRYAVDGFFLNRFHHDHCQCRVCRDAFRAHSGLELPLGEDWDNPAWRAFVRFRYEQMAAYAGRLRAFIRERNPRAILAVDFRLTSDAPQHLREAGWLAPLLAENVDIVTVEAFNPLERPMPRHYLWAGEQVRMGRTLVANRPIGVILTYSEVFSSRRAAQPPAQLAYDLMQIAAHGGQPCVALSGTFDQDDRKALPAVKSVYHYLRDHAESYEDLRSPARVALIYAQATMDLYGRDRVMERCLAEYRGLYEVLVEGHVQFDVLHDASLDVTTLRRYALIVLPNVAVLSDDQVALLDNYVEGGGHLLATFETGLYDDEGRPRESLALRAIGRTLKERLPCAGAYLRILDKEMLTGFEETDLLALSGSFWSTAPASDAPQQLIGLHLIPPVRNNTPEYAYWEEESEAPGLVLSPFGLGEVAYLPWEVGRLYHQLGAPEYRQVILDLVERVVSPLATTNAPSSVELTLHYLGGDPGHALVHLLNATGRQSKPLTEVIPLHDVTVWVHGSYTAARELGTGQDLELTKDGSGVRFVLFRLEGFAAIELLADGF